MTRHSLLPVRAYPYGHQHRNTRKALLAQAIGTYCPCRGPGHWRHHCDGLMTNPARMDLDHSTPVALGGTGAGDRIICASCNRSAGATLGNRLRGPGTTGGFRASRSW